MPATIEKINIWVLPEENITWELFEETILNSGLSTFANVAPNAKTLRQKVSADINAIGLLPSGWADHSVKAIMISDGTEIDLELPITVSTAKEPDDSLSLWLNCVQTVLKD